MNKSKTIALLTAVFVLCSGLLVNAAVFNVKQSPDTFSVNGTPVRQDPAKGVFLLDTYNHRSYMPVSSLLQAAGAKLVQTLKPDGSSNWDFVMPQGVEDVAGGFIIKVIGTDTRENGLMGLEFYFASKNNNRLFKATVDGSKGKDMAKSIPTGANFILFESEDGFVLIDASGEMQKITMEW